MQTNFEYISFVDLETIISTYFANWNLIRIKLANDEKLCANIVVNGSVTKTKIIFIRFKQKITVIYIKLSNEQTIDAHFTYRCRSKCCGSVFSSDFFYIQLDTLFLINIKYVDEFCMEIIFMPRKSHAFYIQRKIIQFNSFIC